MKRFPQIIILIIAFLGVLSLAVFTYRLVAYTLQPAFVGQYSQIGTKGVFLFQAPQSFFASKNTALFDEGALKKAIFFDDTPYEYVQSGTIHLSADTGGIYIDLPNPTAEHRVKISADIYNRSSQSPYRLSKDLLWEYTTDASILEIVPYEQTGALLYEVSLSNQSRFLTQDIRWYVSDNSDLCHQNNSTWNAYDFSRVPAFQRSDIVSINDVYQLDIDIDTQASCIVAGIGNNIVVIDQGNIPEFQFSGSTIAMRSPSLNMQTHIRLETQSTLAKYTTDTIQSYITLTPKIELSASHIEVGDSHIDLFLPLESDKKYTVSLQDIADIYGRTTSYDYTIAPKDRPSLSLGLQSQDIQPQFTPRDEIYAQIFTTGINRSSYTIQLCKLEPSQYLRVRQHLETIQKNKIPTYNYISMHSPGSCFQKEISANADNTKTPFRLDTFSESLLTSGIYMLSFVDKSLLQGLPEFVVPQFFTITDTKLVSVPNAENTYTLLSINANNFRPRAHERIYMYLYRDSTLKATSTDIPRVISLGTTDARGMLVLSPAIQSQIQKVLGQQGVYAVLVSGSQEHFGFIDTPKKLFEAKNIRKTTSHTSSITLFISQHTLNSNDTFTAYGYTHTGIIIIKTPQGDPVREYEISPQNDTFFVQNITLDPQIAQGKYQIEIANKTASGQYETLSRSLNLHIGGDTVSHRDSMRVNFVLQSNSITSSGEPKYLSSYTNSSQESPWYPHILRAPISFEGIIQVSDTRANTPISYAEYTYDFYELDEHTGKRIKIDQGKGKTDTDGFGYIRVSVDFESYGSSKNYICNLILTNPITGEQKSITQTYLVSLPAQEGFFRDDIPLQFSLENTHLRVGESLIGKVFFALDTSDPHINSGSYQYTLAPLQDRENPVHSGALVSSDFSIDTRDLSPQIYQLTLEPSSQELPKKIKKTLTSHSLVLLEGSGMTVPTSVQILPHSTHVNQGDILTVSLVLPYQNGGIVVSAQQGSTSLGFDYASMSGAILTKKYQLSQHSSDSVCISAQTFGERADSSQSLCIPVAPKPQNAPVLQILDSQIIPGQKIAYTLKSETSASYHTNFFLVSQDNEAEAMSWFDSLRNSNLHENPPISQSFEMSPLLESISFSRSFSGTLSLPSDISGKFSLVALTTTVSGENHIHSVPLDISYPYNLQVFAPKFTYKGDAISVDISATNTDESITQFSFVAKMGSGESEYRSQQDAIMNIGQKTTTRFRIPLDSLHADTEKIRVYLKKGDTIIASRAVPISLLDSASALSVPEFSIHTLQGESNTGTSFSGTYTNLSLSLGSDIRLFLLPLIQSLHFQATPDTSSQLTLLFAQKHINKIQAFLPGVSLPKIPSLSQSSFVHRQEKQIQPSDVGELLDSLLMLIDLKNRGIQVSRSYQDDIAQSLKVFLETNQNNYLFADAYRVFAALGVQGADTIREQIDTHRLDRHSRIAYMAGLQSQRRTFSGSMQREAMQSVLTGTTQTQRGWTLFADRMILAQVLLNAGQQGEVDKIFRAMLDDAGPSRVFSFREIREGLRAIVLQSRKTRKISPLDWQFSGGALKIQNTLSTQNPYFVYSLDTQKIGNSPMRVSAKSDASPLTSYLYSFTPGYLKNQSNIRVYQTIEAIDTTAGVYPDGTFKKVVPLSGNELHKNTLYRISIDIENTDISEENAETYVLDIPLISGVNSYFSSHVSQDSYMLPLASSYQSFSNFSALYQSTQHTKKWSYSYYIRPQFSGKYTLPPARVYLESQPQIGATSGGKTLIIP